MNRHKLNKLNTVLLVCQDDINLHYGAYLTSEITQSADILVGDMPMKPYMDSYAAALISNSLSYAPGLNYDRIATFRGSTPASITLNTVLKIKPDMQGNQTLEPSFNRDIRDPLMRLFEIALPSDGMSITELAGERVQNIASDIKDSLVGFVGDVPGIGTPLKNLINYTSDRVKQILDKATTVKIPKMVEPENYLWCYVGTDSDMSTANIVTGPWIIEKITLTLGKLILQGGYPEYVKVDLVLTSMRSQATSEAFSIFKESKIKYMNEKHAPAARDPFTHG